MAAAPPPGWGNNTPQSPQPPAGWGTSPGAGGQPHGSQVQQMGTTPASPPAPTYNVLWPNGIGFTSRDLSDGKDPKGCRPHCGCTMPFQWHDKDMTQHGEASRYSLGCGGFNMENADLLGKRFSFEVNGCCCDEEVIVTEGGNTISKTLIKAYPCTCKNEVEDIVVVSDAAGNQKFARRDNPCFRKNLGRYSGESSVCAWKQIRHPFYKANSEVKLNVAKPVGFITYRYNLCSCCHYQYKGFDEVPNTLTEDEQKMILGLILDPTINTAPDDHNSH